MATSRRGMWPVGQPGRREKNEGLGSIACDSRVESERGVSKPDLLLLHCIKKASELKRKKKLEEKTEGREKTRGQRERE